MKKTAIIITVFAFLSILVISCGSDKSNDSSQEQDKAENSSVKAFSDQYLSVDLGDDWTVSEYGAHNRTYSIFSFKVDSKGNIYDDFNKDHEQVGEVSETTVDGMPAITRLQKFMQNSMKKGRVWLIYDGTNVISFNVAADENKFDDAMAQSIATKVKILNKGQNVKLPTSKKAEFSKPDTFPEETINKLGDALSDNNLLTEETINKAMAVLKTMGQTNKEELKGNAADSIASQYGFSGLNDMLDKTLKPAITCATILNMIKNSKGQKTDATEFLKDFVSQNQVSVADLKFTYAHWDLVMKLYAVSNKK